jgi:hypothetical protein
VGIVRMERITLVVAAVALIFVSAFCAISFAALIQREESKRDPATGYDPPPGESFAYAYQYGEYDPITKKYYNIYSYPDWGWKPNTGNYDVVWSRSLDEDNPWIYVSVWYWYGGEWNLDTYVDISW